MERGLFNIIDANVHTLIPVGSGGGGVKSIRMANGSVDCTAQLYLEDTATPSNKVYIIRSVLLAGGSTLEIDDLGFDNSVLSLNIQLLGSLYGIYNTSIILK
tara:strand:+ start:2596 stop:2901 length:306 start_codon:yes stop_codon:yes gene_type:complete